MKLTEIAWAAGFYDGEGCTSFHPNGTIVCDASQRDPSVLFRLLKAVGRGKVSGPFKSGRYKDGSQKFIYRWKTHKSYESKIFLDLLWPFLSSEKKRQAEEVVRKFLSRKLSRPSVSSIGIKTRFNFCQRGHSLERPYRCPSRGMTYRECSTCRKMRRDGSIAAVKSWKHNPKLWILGKSRHSILDAPFLPIET